MEKEKQTNQDDVILISHLVTILWRRRKMIVLGTVGATLAALIISLLLPRVYRSRAVISLGKVSIGAAHGMAIPVYNNYSNFIQNKRLIIKYFQINYGELYNEWDSSGFKLQTKVEPILGYDKEERVKSTVNFVLGIKVSADANTPEKARRICEVLGNYTRTAIVNLRIGEMIGNMTRSHGNGIVANQKKINDIQFKIKQFKEKETMIVNDLLKIKGFTSDANREVVNASDATAKYLSPRQQLVAVKVSIKDQELAIARLLRENRTSRIILDFLTEITRFIDDKRDFLVKDDLLDNIIREEENYFSSKIDEENRNAFYLLSIQISNLDKLRKVFDYITMPTRPTRSIKPRLKLIVFFSFILALGFFLFLGMVLEWWKKNRNEPN
jgi:LPS O-antigen subunit length determinant protein (WzzB/FepE family)